MPAKQYQIVLDSPTNSYYAGSVVSGRVLLSLDKPKKARGIKLKIVGKARVSWTESESRTNAEGKSESYTETYSAEEEYFSVKYYLIGSSSGDIEIPMGDNVYPFQTTLPPKLPTGFDGEHGSVKYVVEATIDRPWKTDEEIKHYFQVVTPMDLNYIAMAKEPIKKEKEKYFCCCCCKSGPLTVVVHVAQSGFIPGQVMPVLMEIDNASNVGINEVKFKLVKTLTWISRMPRYKEKPTSVELLKIKSEGVGPNSSKTWTENLTIPDMPFLNLDDCSIIKLEFRLEVSAEVSGAHRDLECSSKWILGTVPIASAPFVPGTNDPRALELSGPTKPSAPDDNVVGPPMAAVVSPSAPGDLIAPNIVPGNAVPVETTGARLYPTIGFNIAEGTGQ